MSLSQTSLIGHWSQFQSEPRNCGQGDSRKAPPHKSSMMKFKISPNKLSSLMIIHFSNDFPFIKAFCGNTTLSITLIVSFAILSDFVTLYIFLNI